MLVQTSLWDATAPWVGISSDDGARGDATTTADKKDAESAKAQTDWTVLRTMMNKTHSEQTKVGYVTTSTQLTKYVE